MPGWLDALKKGAALRCTAVVEGDPSARGVLGASADGSWVVVKTSRDVRLYDADLGGERVLARGHRWAAAGFVDGLVVLASGDGGLAGVDLEGRVRWSKDGASDVRGPRPVLCVDASGDVVIANPRGRVRWLDPKNGRQRRSLALEKRSGTTQEFDPETGRSDGPEVRATVQEEIVGVDPVGRFALGWLPRVYFGPHRPGDLRLHDLESGSCTTVLEPTGHPGAMAISAGGRWALGWGVWASIDLWDLSAKKHLGSRPVRESVGTTLWGPSVAMSPDGRHWVSAVEREICLWELSAESPIERIAMPAYPSPDGPMQFSADGRSLYLCLEGRVVRLEVDPDAARA